MRGFSVISCVAGGVLGSVTTIVQLLHVVKIIVAPRLFLIEYFRDLIR